jgi:adenosylcobinamide kinase / adenosylcobinamide-phosphate guanylyltransferase
MGKLTLILGGARSGKSSYAERLALQHPGRVAYIATAQALDAEMQARITVHQQKRPASWQTLEIPQGIAEALQIQQVEADLFLLDCLTLLVSNRLIEAAGDLDQPDEAAASQAVETEIQQLIRCIHDSPAEWIIVSNEVGLGLVPPYPVGRLYRDLLGWANQRLATHANPVLFMIAGLPMRLSPA